MKTFNDLFMHFLKDMYFAEQSILKMLPELAAAADDGKLGAVLQGRAEETRQQIARLEEAFKALDQKPEGVTCEAILGLLQETEDVLNDGQGKGALQDAGLLACLQAIQHYEIARFNTLGAWARAKGLPAASHLQGALDVANAQNATLDDLAAAIHDSAVAA